MGTSKWHRFLMTTLLFLTILNLSLGSVCPPPNCECNTRQLPEENEEKGALEAICKCPEHGVIPEEIREHLFLLTLDFSDRVVLANVSLPHFPNLRRLSLSGVQYILPGVFLGLEGLDRFTLKDNFMRVFETEMFFGLTHLTQLTVTPSPKWKIHALENGSFIGLSKLHSLNLTGNFISTLETDYFRDLYTLTKLDMSWNELAQVLSETFRHMYNVEILYLQGNKLRLIQRNAFLGLKKLKFLHLEDNLLRGMSEPNFEMDPQSLMSNAPSVHQITIYLRNNRLQCGCHLNWVSKWLDIDGKHCEGTCTGPPQYADHTLSYVYEAGLTHCHNNGSVYQVQPSEILELPCPIEDIYWSTPRGHTFKEVGEYNDSYFLTNEGSLIILSASTENTGTFTCVSAESDGNSNEYLYEVNVAARNGGTSFSWSWWLITIIVLVIFCFVIVMVKCMRGRQNYDRIREPNVRQPGYNQGGISGDGYQQPVEEGVGTDEAASGVAPPNSQATDGGFENEISLDAIYYKGSKSSGKVIPQINTTLTA